MRSLYTSFQVLLLICGLFLYSLPVSAQVDIQTEKDEDGIKVLWEDFSETGYYQVVYDYYDSDETNKDFYLFSGEVVTDGEYILDDLEEDIEYIVQVQALDEIGDKTGEVSNTSIVQLVEKSDIFALTEEEVTTQTYEQISVHFTSLPEQNIAESIQIRSNKDSTLLNVLHSKIEDNNLILFLHRSTPLIHDSSYTLFIDTDILSKDGINFSGESRYDFVSFIPESVRLNWLQDNITKADAGVNETEIDRLPDTGNEAAFFLILLAVLASIYAAAKMYLILD